MSPAFLSFWEKICSQGFSSVDAFLRMFEQDYSHCFICVLPSLPLPPISRNLWFIVHFFPVPIAVLLPKPEFEMWNLEKEWLHRIQRCIVTLTIKSRCTSGGRVSPAANIDMGFKAWFIYFFLPFVVLSVLSERHLNDWLVLGKHLEFCFFLVFFFGHCTNRKNCNAFFFFLPTNSVCLSFFPTEGAKDNPAKKLEKRNDDKSIQDARARYLERKQQRAQGLSGPLKEVS